MVFLQQNFIMSICK